MSPEAVRFVIDRYAKELDCLACAPGLGGAMAVGALDPDGIPPHCCRLWYGDPVKTEVPPEQRRHVLEMFPKMRAFLDQGRVEKCMRWLGFVQGWLWAIGRYQVPDLAEHNREAAKRFPGQSLLARLGRLLPTMLDSLPWGAYKGVLLQDGTIKAAIREAERSFPPAPLACPYGTEHCELPELPCEKCQDCPTCKTHRAGRYHCEGGARRAARNFFIQEAAARATWPVRPGFKMAEAGVVPLKDGVRFAGMDVLVDPALRPDQVAFAHVRRDGTGGYDVVEVLTVLEPDEELGNFLVRAEAMLRRR